METPAGPEKICINRVSVIKESVIIKFHCTHNRKKSKTFDDRPHGTLCRYCGLNDPFSCVHHIRDSQCFSLGRTTPYNCPRPSGPWAHQINDFLAPQMAFESVQWFLQDTSMWQTDRQTMLHVTSVATGHILHTVCMRCRLIIITKGIADWRTLHWSKEIFLVSCDHLALQ